MTDEEHPFPASGTGRGTTGPPHPPYQASQHTVDTSTGKAHGISACPQCGSSQARRAEGGESLACEFCRYEWVAVPLEATHRLGEGIADLRGVGRSTGAAPLNDDGTLVAIRCQGCAGDVVIDSGRHTRVRCHWCRSVLSLNDKVASGIVADGIVPVTVTRAEAVEKIRAFVTRRRIHVNRRFRKEFDPENIEGLYLPYFVVDGTFQAAFTGSGEVTTSVLVGDRNTYYDVDVYEFSREFDVHVDDLVVEASSRLADFSSKHETVNVVNAVLPCAVKDMVPFRAAYLGEFNVEPRDLDIPDASPLVHEEFLSIAKSALPGEVRFYDRGVVIASEQVSVRGTRWVTVYLPVWLYSYTQAKRRGTSVIHYVAVNGRDSDRVSGSVPVSRWRMHLTALVAAGVFGGIAIPWMAWVAVT